MTLNNPCELIKKIHADPFIQITDLTIGEFQSLQKHLTECPECDKLVTEVLERYKDIKPHPKMNDGRWN